MNHTEIWTQVVREIPGGLIAMVNGDSPEEEQVQVVEFSRQHHSDMCSESFPYLDMSLFQEPALPFWCCQVFAAIVGGRIVGYAKFFWIRSWLENSEDEVLGEDRTPLTLEKVRAGEPSPLGEMTIKELFEDEAASYPYHLKTWCGSGIGVLGDYRGQGIATALLRTAEECLGTKLEDMGFSLPTSEGKALLKSLGLPYQSLILYYPGSG